MSEKDWIGVDLDGTLAAYQKGDWNLKGPLHIGEPIGKMVEFVRGLLREGHRVKIMTARVAPTNQNDTPDLIARIEEAIQAWTLQHLGQALEVTCIKDGYMRVLYDDRARQVVNNMGIVVAQVDVVEMSTGKKVVSTTELPEGGW